MKIKVIYLLLAVTFLVGCGDAKKEFGTDEANIENTIVAESSNMNLSVDEPLIPDGIKGEADSNSKEASLEDKVSNIVQNMSIEEKVAQMFVILPEALVSGVDCVTAAGSTTKDAFNEFPVGGIVYLTNNLQSYEQVQNMLSNMQIYSNERTGLSLFLCVDEEGGSVARVAESGIMDVKLFDSMATIGERQSVSEAYEVGNSIGQYLVELGFNVNFAPVADVFTNAENQVVRGRAFSSDPGIVSNMASAVAKGLSQNGILATYKHFPGHGNTTADTHAGYAYTDKSIEELLVNELVPFQKGIEQGIPFIMIGHISLPTITGSDVPASLSSYIVKDLLRKEMEYKGIIITDALNMGAIVQQYSSREAAVKAIQAGNDMLLMPADAESAYNGILDALAEGQLSEKQIDESVYRIVQTKLALADDRS